MRLSDSDIRSLLMQKPITGEWPWSSENDSEIENHVKDVVAEIRRKLRLLDKTVFNHYGSGYASFIDCWLYRVDENFRASQGDDYWGLAILFSRLSPYFVVGEGEKSWHDRGGSSYMPDFRFVDRIEKTCNLEIVDGVCNILGQRGFQRLRKEDLGGLLSPGTKVPTLLSDQLLRQFDALFYWED